MASTFSFWAARDLARDAFYREAPAHLTDRELMLYSQTGAWSDGPLDATVWEAIVGFSPDPKSYREINILTTDEEQDGIVVLASVLIGGDVEHPYVRIDWRPSRFAVPRERKSYSDEFVQDFLTGKGELSLKSQFLIGDAHSCLIGFWLPAIGFRYRIIENDGLSRACKDYLRKHGARQFASSQEVFDAAEQEHWPREQSV